MEGGAHKPHGELQIVKAHLYKEDRRTKRARKGCRMSKAFLIVVVSLLGLTATAHAVDYAPLECAKAKSETEKTICSDYSLGQSEARMATLFELTTSLVAMGQRGDIQDAQRGFIKQREACGANIACIRNAYGARIKQLEGVMSGIASHGPF